MERASDATSERDKWGKLYILHWVLFVATVLSVPAAVGITGLLGWTDHRDAPMHLAAAGILLVLASSRACLVAYILLSGKAPGGGGDLRRDSQPALFWAAAVAQAIFLLFILFGVVWIALDKL